MATRQIGDKLFVIAPLPAMRSWLLQPRLVPVIVEVARLFGLFVTSAAGRALFGDEAAADGNGDEKRPLDAAKIDPKKLSIQEFLDLDLDLAPTLDVVADAAARVCRQLPPRELEMVTRELLAGATCNGVPLFGAAGGGDAFDVLMQGSTITTWRLIVWAVQVNYPDVFSPRAATAAASPLGAPSAA